MEPSASAEPQPPAQPRISLSWLAGVSVLVFAGLLLYSQTLAFAWDEGFHLLAAQLIKAGKRPYLDFCFPQTPLNAYLNAQWMRWFGESWRAVHVLSAFWVAAGAFLVGDFFRSRFPESNWRFPAALAALAAVALNSQVVLFGTIGQAYGICLFLIVAAFRTGVLAVERRSPLWAALTGLLAATAAGCSLLSAAAGPVLFLWVLLQNRAGSRYAKAALFAIASAVPFLPIVMLYRQSPQQVLFNIYRYQVLYRRARWDGATGQDLSTVTSWINSAQGLSLAILALAGVWFLARQSTWKREQQSEFYLAGFLALALGLELATAHPTFERYFMLMVPFAVIPAVVGLFAVGERMGLGARPWLPAVFLIGLTFMGLAKGLIEDWNSWSWKDCEAVAKKIDDVTAPHAPLWTDELFYFLTRRQPPDGMEFSYAHDVDLPPDQAALYHVLPAATVHHLAQSGAYATVAACYESDQTDKINLPGLFRRKEEVRDCTVYWDFAGK